APRPPPRRGTRGRRRRGSWSRGPRPRRADLGRASDGTRGRSRREGTGRWPSPSTTHRTMHISLMTTTIERAVDLPRDEPEAYIARDRRWALATHRDMPDRVAGSALFADISGFTPLTEAPAHAPRC